jgi:2-polyprenyl-3-methyl-5-hydroxy-6-metoxy-1,4-benzoquinol methylase
MKVDQKGTQLQLKILKRFHFFLMKVTHQYKTFEKHNIIIDLLHHKDLTINDIKLFLPYQTA